MKVNKISDINENVVKLPINKLIKLKAEITSEHINTVPHLLFRSYIP